MDQEGLNGLGLLLIEREKGISLRSELETLIDMFAETTVRCKLF